MRWRRLLLLALIGVALVWLYQSLLLAMTAGKLLGFAGAFDRWRGPVSRSAVHIGSIPADIYATPKFRFPVLFVHGVSEAGKDSPEVRPAAEAFAGSSFRVIVPDFARLKRQNVTSQDIDDVVFIFKSLKGPGGIVCASYGCGPALIAAARPEIRDRVRFVVTFGGYFDLTSALRFIATSPTSALAYSKWVYMAGNADLLGSEADRQELIAIASERRQRAPEEWTLSGESLGPDAYAILRLFESRNAEEFDSRLAAAPALSERLQSLSPSRYFGDLRARLIIVHMSSDPSIPSSESLRMAEAAKARSIRHSLTILNIYGHTRPNWPQFGAGSLFHVYLPESWKFMRALRETLSFASFQPDTAIISVIQ